MFSYVTAIAVAATLTISPVIAGRASVPAHDTKGTRAASLRISAETHAPSISIADTICLAGQRSIYFLSAEEQKALKRALLRSVRIISPSA